MFEIGVRLRAHDQILVIQHQGRHAAQVVVAGQRDVGVDGFAPGGVSQDGRDVGLGQPGCLPQRAEDGQIGDVFALEPIGVLDVFVQRFAPAGGLGLGLFGVLSIIRLRSAEMEHDEVAYFFSALALGLLGGFPLSPTWLSPLLMFSVVLAIFLADHPRLFGSRRHQIMTLDRAFVDEGVFL